uniref:C2H2-type domain-containing protein n=1 Tax=Onchocerca volvulus TaxID=6282 RepID=A0A8R1Y2G6_ONCVO
MMRKRSINSDRNNQSFEAKEKKNATKQLNLERTIQHQKLPNKMEKKIHMKKHTNEISDIFKCDVCGKQFPYQCRLRIHMHRHTGERSFKCNQCGKEFKYASNLKGHEQTHTNVDLFKCDKCGKIFTRNYNLKRHQKRHKCSAEMLLSIVNSLMPTSNFSAIAILINKIISTTKS